MVPKISSLLSLTLLHGIIYEDPQIFGGHESFYPGDVALLIVAYGLILIQDDFLHVSPVILLCRHLHAVLQCLSALDALFLSHGGRKQTQIINASI